MPKLILIKLVQAFKWVYTAVEKLKFVSATQGKYKQSENMKNVHKPFALCSWMRAVFLLAEIEFH